ncbi:MAG TPA: hypothetical protein VHO27_03655, partial [Angustibacter sp.]|nr:hypothetical protein [Angustibacter sp.]
DLLLGVNRWWLRVAAYASLMTDQYPPFRLDLGAHEVVTSSVAASPAPPAPPAPAETPPPALAVNPPPPAAPPAGSPAAPGRWTAGRVVSVVVGAILALGSLGLLTAGFAGVVADRTMRDGGYLMTHVGTVTSGGYAVVTDDVVIEGSSAGGRFWPARMLGDLRVTATNRDATTPVFVGIAPAAQVDRYLAGVQRSVQSTPGGRHSNLTGSAPTVAPGDLDIWVAQASGTGEQQLTWTPARGSWALVVMNADASRGVDVELDAGATLPALPWIGAALMLAGAALLVAGTLLVVLPVRAASAART